MLATGRATSGRLGRARALLERHEQAAIPTSAVCPTGLVGIDAALPNGGLGRGQTHEFLAVDPPLTILAALSARALADPTTACVWIGFTPTPHLLATTLGEHWSRRCLIVIPTSDDQRLWAADQALRCPAVSAVIADASRFPPAATRRLQLAAEQTDVLALFARPMRERTTRSACATRWLVDEPPTTRLRGSSHSPDAARPARRPPPMDPDMEELRTRCAARSRSGSRTGRPTATDAARTHRLTAPSSSPSRSPTIKRVARRCAIAAREGVREELSLANARAMLDAPVVADFDPTADREALHQLAQWALRFSPTVAIDPHCIHLVGVEPDALLMDIAGCEHLFQGEHNLAQQLITELKELHFRALVGIGPTIGSAWAAAHFDPVPITIIADPREQLADYPVRALRVEHDTAEALAELGIERVGQLIGLPRHQLPARFGDELLLRLDQALGQALDGQDLTPTRPEPPREVEQRFAGPTTQVEAIDLAVQQLLRKLCTQLASREQGVLELVAAFERIPKAGIRPETARESITLSAPARDPKHLWSLLRPKVERLHLGFGIEQIALTAARVGRTRHRQHEHWTDSADHAPAARELTALIDTLTAKLGRAHVLHMRAAASRLPEQEQVLSPAIERAQKRDIPDLRARTRLVPRPSFMFAKPEPASVIALRPDHPPSLVRWNGDVFHVEHGSGPERLADEWWNADAPQREYFRVRLDDGRWIWIYRQSARWFVHGLWS